MNFSVETTRVKKYFLVIKILCSTNNIYFENLSPNV